jgi:Tol biopolymer transport system component
MSRLPLLITVALLFAVSTADRAAAVKVETIPATQDNDTNDIEFESIVLSPDGTTIVGVGNFDLAYSGAERHRLVSLPVPSAGDPDGPVNITTLSRNDFAAPFYDADFTPAISPNGATVLVEHNGIGGTNTIFKVPIAGEGSSPFTPLFNGTDNRVAPGQANGNPQYSPNGNTIFFLNFNSGFGGSVPTGPFGENSFRGAPSWNQIYSVPAAGGAPTPITLAGNGTINAGGGSIDRDLWAVTPNGASIVYAPDVPLVARQTGGDRRTKLFSVAATGGTPTEIPVAPASHGSFSISRQVEVTPDGSRVLFIGDYLTGGRDELFSVPIGGGTPTRISDNLAFAGDVKSFKISPDGTKVAYAAGQNVSANTELFLKNLNGAPGSSIRVSDPPALGGVPGNGGQPDVWESAGRGTILFSNDGSRIFYRGDMETNGIVELFSVDTTAKGGLVPSAYTFTGAPGSDFFDENNWRDAQNNAPPAGTITPGSTAHSLIIPAGLNVTAAGQVSFVQGGSLEMLAGSVLNITTGNGGGGANGFITQNGSGLRMTNAQLLVDSGIHLQGEQSIIGSTLRAGGIESDLYFDQLHDSVVSGSTLEATDVVGFENNTTVVDSDIVTGAFSLKFESEVIIRDTTIDAADEIQDAVEDNADNTLLRLVGTSDVTGTSLWDGVSAVIDDSAALTLTGSYRGHIAFVGNGEEPFPADKVGTITLASTDAELFLNGDENPQSIAGHIINGLTGLTYAQDPNAWNVTNWNGTDPIGLLKLVAGPSTDGDFDGDEDVDGRDFLAWQRGESPDPLSAGDFADWKANFGTVPAAPATGAVPEPGAGLLALACGLAMVTLRKRG